MSLHTIFVKLHEEGPHLDLTEGTHQGEALTFETEVSAGDTIKWQLSSDSGIASLERVKPYSPEERPDDADLISASIKNSDGSIQVSVHAPASHGELHESYLMGTERIQVMKLHGKTPN